MILRSTAWKFAADIRKGLLGVNARYENHGVEDSVLHIRKALTQERHEHSDEKKKNKRREIEE